MFNIPTYATVFPSTSAGFLNQTGLSNIAYHNQHVEYVLKNAGKHKNGSVGENSSSEDEFSNVVPVGFNGTTYYRTPNTFPSNTPSTISALFLESLSKFEIHHLASISFKATREELRNNGYPMFENGQKKVATFKDTKYTTGKRLWIDRGEKMRRCSRCHTEFELEKNGAKNQRECVYHPKGKMFDEVRGEYVRLCCDDNSGFIDGCQMRRCHVFDQLATSELENFVSSKKPFGKKDTRSKAIYAIDAEMVYTIDGPALARLSVVDWDGELVLDVLVKPPTTVIDPNTEFSGLTIDDVNSATDTLETCRRKFLSLVNEKTILVGHSLESDLKALRLVHNIVVDTSLLYMSNGKKVGLKKLALDHLGIKIQSNNPEMQGHDSQEDARVALDLLKLRMAKCY